MQQVPSDPSTAVLFGDFESIDPSQLFRYLTEPELITQWWPPVAEGEPVKGGNFVYRWPDQDWTLRGEFLTFEPGRTVSFTWNWDHEPVKHGTQKVEFWIEPYLEKGSLLSVFHGKFENTEEDQAARQGVAEGWIHFLMKLAGLSDGLAG